MLFTFIYNTLIYTILLLFPLMLNQRVNQLILHFTIFDTTIRALLTNEGKKIFARAIFIASPKRKQITYATISWISIPSTNQPSRLSTYTVAVTITLEGCGQRTPPRENRSRYFRDTLDSAIRDPLNFDERAPFPFVSALVSFFRLAIRGNSFGEIITSPIFRSNASAGSARVSDDRRLRRWARTYESITPPVDLLIPSEWFLESESV